MLIWASYVMLWGAMPLYFVHMRSNRDRVGRIASGLAIVSWCLLTAALIQRGFVSGHWPLTNRYEVTLCVGWAILLVYWLLEISWNELRGGFFIIIIALLTVTYAISRPTEEQAITPLLPILRSVWLQLHVVTTLIGYGSFGVAAGLGLMQLVKLTTPEGKQNVTLPTQKAIELSMERVVALGFAWLSLGILTGAIWAQKAWGRYWGWDPKETWALITWLWYLLILHIRALRAWRGRRLAGLVVAGFAVVVFTFIGVPWLVRTVRLESLHGF
jgi:cytochrome c-type biogenesis protein CcsB